MSTQVYGFIQARMNSTRLPNKVLLPIRNKPILQHIIEACQQGGVVPVVITPIDDEQQPIVKLCKQLNVTVSQWPGVTRDPLSEFVYAAQNYVKHTLAPIIRLTADCPMHRPEYIRKFANFLHRMDVWDFATNRPCDIDGLDLEGFYTVLLYQTHIVSTDIYDREHVCPAMRRLAKRVHVFSVTGNPNDFVAPGKVSVDTHDEYMYVKKLMEENDAC